jgi:hypothetical protein|tara:strand:+ start:3276 stop:3428 length:153 start_codon:yes stop_codon:yes gene_type:complete
MHLLWMMLMNKAVRMIAIDRMSKNNEANTGMFADRKRGSSCEPCGAERYK